MENSVVLIDYMGGDNLHAVNAWASTFLDLGVDMPDAIHERTDTLTDAILNSGGRKRDVPGLIRYLAQHKPKHMSPFRASKFVFGVCTDIATQYTFLSTA